MVLMLSQRHLQTIPIGIINQYKKHLEYLNLSHNRISSFEWIYEFTNLKHLILDSNRLDETHLQKISKPVKNILVLMLNKNEFSDLNNTATLLGKIFPNLEYLSLHGNPICPDGLCLKPFSGNISYEYDFYKSRLMISLPKLKFLDHSNVHSNTTATVPVHNVRILTFSPKKLMSKLLSVTTSVCYSPACSQQGIGYHSGHLCRLSTSDNIHNGTESEGNRFISNNDL